MKCSRSAWSASADSQGVGSHRSRNATSLDVTNPEPPMSNASWSFDVACFRVSPGMLGKLTRQSTEVSSSTFHSGVFRRIVAPSCSNAATQQPYWVSAHFLKMARTMAMRTSTSRRRTVPSSSRSMARQSATTSPLKPIFRQPFRSSVCETARFPLRSMIFRQPRMKLPPDEARTFRRNSRRAALSACRCSFPRRLQRLAVALAASRPIANAGLRITSRLRALSSRMAMSRMEMAPTPSRSRIWKMSLTLLASLYSTQASSNRSNVTEASGIEFSVLNICMAPPYRCRVHLRKSSMRVLSSGEISWRPTAESSPRACAL
mmetsp:Transcript_109251/g.309090  ORF Transcript_109251/g.309090 Transcript_109251/m.309090 type:complete len:319 (+) Transcript_109251:997-1953(+)